jgi:hypothetical protein
LLSRRGDVSRANAFVELKMCDDFGWNDSDDLDGGEERTVLNCFEFQFKHRNNLNGRALSWRRRRRVGEETRRVEKVQEGWRVCGKRSKSSIYMLSLVPWLHSTSSSTPESRPRRSNLRPARVEKGPQPSNAVIIPGAPSGLGRLRFLSIHTRRMHLWCGLVQICRTPAKWHMERDVVFFFKSCN